MADVDPKIISHFLCTDRLDSTQMDLDLYLMKEDLLFFPMKNHHNLKHIHDTNLDRYHERMEILFSPYREKN